ncbi:MAG: thermonuclease family protein [Candidatus Wallbacteria bacterium]|nr:thermonuclease family protein [Candidatus Wallbacteria bacterium]
MKKIPQLPNLLLMIFVLCILVYFMTSGRNDQLREISGTVVAIADGDTFRIIINHRRDTVRLLGIDCPEKDQKYGPAATEFARGFLMPDHKPGQEVRLEFDIERRDKYGRLLAFVYNSKGEMLNRELLRSGLSRTLFIDPNSLYRQEFREIAAKAKKSGLNIWNPADPLPETPSEYRKLHREDTH